MIIKNIALHISSILLEPDNYRGDPQAHANMGQTRLIFIYLLSLFTVVQNLAIATYSPTCAITGSSSALFKQCQVDGHGSDPDGDTEMAMSPSSVRSDSNLIGDVPISVPWLNIWLA
jgi:hypothetical protein